MKFATLLAWAACLGLASFTSSRVAGAEPELRAAEVSPLKFSNTQATYWQLGVEVQAQGGPCKGLVASLPIPADWPEQKVKVLEERATANAKIAYRSLAGGVKQMVISIPNLRAGETASGMLLLEITKSEIVGPEATEGLSLPRAAPELAAFLAPSPLIESQHPTIRELAPTVIKGESPAWKQAEAIYDFVRSKVKYVEGDLKGAVAALRDGEGDCEELTSLFIALCRANKIPARTVWVPGHCYPEFYLVDAEGQGHWFPCQAAGDRQFGSMPEKRPILQKGDNFRVPEHATPQRYVTETMKGIAVRGAGNPQAKFFRQQVPEGTQLAPAASVSPGR